MAEREGWLKPINMSRFHYFHNGRSLCGKVFVMGFGALEQMEAGEEPWRDDCKS